MSRTHHGDPVPLAPSPPPPTPEAARPGGGSSRLLPLLGVVLGLLGLVAGVAAWFRAAPATPAAPSYSEQQVADAEKAVCDAYAKGIRTIHTVGSVKVDPENWFPTAINTRLAGFAVGTYFLDSLAANPAAPSELKSLIQAVGDAYRDIALTQLADGTPADYHASNEIVQQLVPDLDRECQS